MDARDLIALVASSSDSSDGRYASQLILRSLSCPEDFNAVDKVFGNQINNAVATCPLSVVGELSLGGMQLNIPSASGKYLLHLYFARTDNFPVGMLAKFVTHGANVNAADSNGDTVLHKVARTQHINEVFVVALVGLGADLFAVNKDNEVAFQLLSHGISVDRLMQLSVLSLEARKRTIKEDSNMLFNFLTRAGFDFHRAFWFSKYFMKQSIVSPQSLALRFLKRQILWRELECSEDEIVLLMVALAPLKSDLCSVLESASFQEWKDSSYQRNSMESSSSWQHTEQDDGGGYEKKSQSEFSVVSISPSAYPLGNCSLPGADASCLQASSRTQSWEQHDDLDSTEGFYEVKVPLSPTTEADRESAVISHIVPDIKSPENAEYEITEATEEVESGDGSDVVDLEREGESQVFHQKTNDQRKNSESSLTTETIGIPEAMQSKATDTTGTKPADSVCERNASPLQAKAAALNLEVATTRETQNDEEGDGEDEGEELEEVQLWASEEVQAARKLQASGWGVTLLSNTLKTSLDLPAGAGIGDTVRLACQILKLEPTGNLKADALAAYCCVPVVK